MKIIYHVIVGQEKCCGESEVIYIYGRKFNEFFCMLSPLKVLKSVLSDT